jgi:hypothetical protein
MIELDSISLFQNLWLKKIQKALIVNETKMSAKLLNGISFKNRHSVFDFVPIFATENRKSLEGFKNKRIMRSFPN